MSALCAIILCITLVISSIPVFAAINSTVGSNLTSSNWMSGIQDDALISDISIPGTHDSGTKVVDTGTSTWAQCQNLTISEQLSVGVRYLDMRLSYDTAVAGNISVVHSSINCWTGDGNGKLTLSGVLTDVYSFLANNPTETVIVSMKEDNGSNESSIVSEILSRISENPSYWYTTSATPKLKDVRGKIVLAARMSSLYPALSLNWSDQGGDGQAVQASSILKVQDRYEMDRDSKWTNAVVPMLEETKPNGMFYINFLSTSKGGIAGIDGPQKNSGYVNGWFNTYELKNNKCYGIVAFDFINENLAKKVYQCNDLVSKTQADPMQGQYYYRVNINTTSAISSGNWGYVVLKLYYRSMNGKGLESSVTLFEKDSSVANSYIYVTDNGNYDFSGVVNGFPTRLEFTYYFTGGSNLVTQQTLYVGKDAGSNLTLTASNNFDGPAGSGTESYESAVSTYPVPSSISFTDNNAIAVTAPNIGAASDTYTLNANVFDQYGVLWYESATSYSLRNTFEGVSLSGNVLTVSSSANNNTISPFSTYVDAYYTSGDIILKTGDDKRLTVTTRPIPYSFLNYDGSVLYSSSDYAGNSPVYAGSTPVKPSDDTYHYTFAGWTPSTVLTIYNNKYTAQYSSAKHTLADAVIENEITASLKSDGSYDSVVYCSVCGREISRESHITDAVAKAEIEVYNSTLTAAEAIDLSKYEQVTIDEFELAFNEAVDLYDNAQTVEDIERATDILVAAISALDNYIADFTNLEKAYQAADAFLLELQDRNNALYSYDDVEALTDAVAAGKVYLDMNREDTLKNLYQISIDNAANRINEELAAITETDASAFTAAYDIALKYDKDIYTGAAVETANQQKELVYVPLAYGDRTLYVVDESHIDTSVTAILEALTDSTVIYNVEVSNGVEVINETRNADGVYEIPYGKEIVFNSPDDNNDTAWYMTYTSVTTQRVWQYQASGKQYTMKVLGNIKINAQSKNAENFKVALIRNYGEKDTVARVERVEYVKGSYILPVPTIMPSYVCKGYEVPGYDGYLQSGDEIAVNEDTVINIIYEYDENTYYTVTVNDTTGNPVSSESYAYNAKVTVSTDEPDVVAFLEKTGENTYRIFIYKTQFTFCVSESIVLEPATEERLEELGLDTSVGYVNLRQAGPTVLGNRTVFNAQYVLPRGAVLKECGILVGMPEDGPISVDDLLLENVGIESCYTLKRCKSTIQTSANQYAIAVSDLKSDMIYRGYLIYEMGAEIITVYTEKGINPDNLPDRDTDFGSDDEYDDF